MSVDIVCLGNVVVDVFGRTIDGLPPKGGLGLFDTLEIQCGGCAFNTGVGLARLGRKVGLVARVGADLLGEQVLAALEDEGIETWGVTRAARKATGFSFVMVGTDGERRILHCLGANAELGPDDVSARWIEGTRHLHVGGAGLLPGLDGQPLAAVLRAARERGLTTSMDTAVNGRLPDYAAAIRPALSHLDLFLPSREEAARITALENPVDMASQLSDEGVGTVVIKMGSRGSYVRSGEISFHAGVYPVKAVDTCGAGDAYVAGFLSAYLAGRDLARSVTVATAVAACCVSSLGSTTGLPRGAELDAFLESQENDLPLVG
jgi:sugar/nucleoside kinase (ribokinase family)